LRIGGSVGREHLYCHNPVESLVAGTEDDGRRALADLRFQSVPGQLGSGCYDSTYRLVLLVHYPLASTCTENSTSRMASHEE